ncbi:MAG: hypothetical protein HY748_10005 [Elusimicrobia bacterium]|nr:hypothetical protein [Elusimicrobiota bacterium]
MPAVLAAALFGCSTMSPRSRPPEPTSPTNGAIVARVVLNAGWFGTRSPYSMTFHRLKADGRPDEAVFVTNFKSGRDVYLLDAVPGRYVPVSVRYMRQNNSYDIGFPEKALKDLAVGVRPGSAVFAGRLTVAVKGRAGKRSEFLGADLNKEAEIAAMDCALKDLDGTLWRDMVARRRESLGPSEAAVTEKGKVVPRQSKGKYTYVDMLGWGSPVRIRGGLEWRQPQGRARIALVWFTQDMREYKSPAEHLAALRSAGSPEDDHKVSEVVFCSRTGYEARYTTYFYPEGTLVGSLVKVYLTETLLVPEPEGVFFLHYRAEKAHFEKFHPQFRAFRDKIVLNPNPPLPAGAAGRP